MPVKIENVIFELDKVYQTYADLLLQSSEVASLMHKGGNISSTGNQIEISIRKLLLELLPPMVHVGHGHIVDRLGKVSNQQDIILAENFYSKSIFKTLDGTEFFTYESIYGTCEVKKSWSLSTLKSTVKSIKYLKKKLNRNDITAKLFNNAGSSDVHKLDEDEDINIKNPLLNLAFAIDFSNKTSFDSFKSIIEDRSNWPFLPNSITILKRGIFLLIDENEIQQGNMKIKLYPQFEINNGSCNWYFFNCEEFIGQNLALLIFMISQHITDSKLENISLLEYGTRVLKINRKSLYNI